MKKIMPLFIIIMVSLIFAGCTINPQSGNTASGIPDSGGNVPEGIESGKGEANPMDDPADEAKPDEKLNDGQISQTFSAANLEFSWNLFKKLNAEDSAENIFISPYSISSALTMALNGAEGNTRVEMEKTLQVDGLTRDELNPVYADEASRLAKLDKKVTLQNANSIWIRNGFDVNSDFIDMNRKYLEAEAQTLDFNDPSSTEVINGWVSNKTNRLIPQIITPPIPQEAVMYLINAIYFKGEWTTEFKPENTLEKDFYAADGKTDKVSMMFRSGRIDYFSNEELQAVRLPYGDEKVSMVVVLPQKDLNGWIDSMNGDKWKEILTGLHPVNSLQLQIPRFKMEYGLKELNSALSELGMKEAFSEGADFSGIAKNIYISRILHKAVVDVNEQGTEAAAVTSIEVVFTSAAEPIAFTADRPFFFAITDNETGKLLFMGKMVTGDSN